MLFTRYRTENNKPDTERKILHQTQNGKRYQHEFRVYFSVLLGCEFLQIPRGNQLHTTPTVTLTQVEATTRPGGFATRFAFLEKTWGLTKKKKEGIP